MISSDREDRERQTRDLERLIRAIHYQLIRLSRPALGDRGMTPPRFHLLYHVVEHAPVDMGGVHAKMHLSRSSLTSLVDGLVDEGLVERRRSEEDRRHVVLTPTRAGVDLVHNLWSERCNRLAPALAHVSDRRLDTLVATLESIESHLQDDREPGGTC